MNTKRVVIISSAVVGALLVAVLVVGIVLLNTVNAQADKERYQDCMASYGFEAGSPPDAGDDEVDSLIDQMVDAAEFCSR